MNIQKVQCDQTDSGTMTLLLRFRQEVKNSFNRRTVWQVSSLGLHLDLSAAEVHCDLHGSLIFFKLVRIRCGECEGSNLLHNAVPSFVLGVQDIITVSRVESEYGTSLFLAVRNECVNESICDCHFLPF